MGAALRDYAALTKPRVTALVIVTTWLGFALASKAPSYTWLWFHTIFGTWLVASGASVLNQYMEREWDKRMKRTANRPLPSGRMAPVKALIFGLAISGMGTVELWVGANRFAALLALMTLVSYVWVYTPMKRKSSVSTLVGAVPGAMPPLIGWAAADNGLEPLAWVIFAIMFVWQLPHFLAIAWIYREDYARAGFPMLTVIDGNGAVTSRMILIYSGVLIPVTLLPSVVGHAGFGYAIGAVVLGSAFLYVGAQTAFYRTVPYARKLLLASIIYLPALLAWMVVTKA